MSEPGVKRFRLQDLTKQISEQTLQNFARTALESVRSADNQLNGDSELKRKYRKSTLLKPSSIRPMPLRESDGFHAPFKYSITKQPLGNVIFDHNNEYSESMGPKYECPVYEFKNKRKLTFFPIVTSPKADQLYACADCFCVYSIMTVLRNRLETIPACKWEELGETKDPRRFPHYCSHLDALSKAQKLYFKEFYYQYKHDEHKLLEHAFNIGLFVKKLCSYDTKTAKFCQESDGQDDNSLVNYIQGLDYTLKEESNAKSFLECFKTLHKNEITVDDQGRIQIEGTFESSQDTAPMSDSQNSQSSQSSQQRPRRALYVPPASNHNSIQSMKSTLAVTGQQSKASTPNDSQNEKHAHSSQEESQTPLNTNIAELNIFQELLSSFNGNTDTQPVNQSPELDLKQFVTGLLMSTLSTVKNAQLQVLYDGLRPLVARYSPESLTSFVTIIHKIDKNMPSEQPSVKLNTVPPTRIVEPPRIITTTTELPNQNSHLPKILRRVITPGTSKNPITLDDDQKNNLLLPK